MQSSQEFCLNVGFTHPQRKINHNPKKCLISVSSFSHEKPSINRFLFWCFCCYHSCYYYYHYIVWHFISQLPDQILHWHFIHVWRYVEHKHNPKHFPGTIVAHKRFPGFLIGKTNVRILKFLVQIITIMCWKVSPRYIMFPCELVISEGKNAFSSLYNPNLLCLKTFTQD